MIKKTLISLKHNNSYDKNPFIVELKNKMFLQPRVNTFVAKGEKIIDVVTGEILDENLLLGRRKLVDKSQFAKIYISEIGLLYDLSKPAMNILLYFMQIMDFENKAIFDYIKEFKKTGYKSKTSCLYGVQELLSRGIIAKHTVDNIYWINPTIVCKGERFATYTEYLAKKEDTKNQNLNIKETSTNEG